LNAQVDLNTDKVNLLRQKVYANTKTALANFGSFCSTDFTVVASINIDNQLQLSELMTLADKQNPMLQAQIM
jgi:hypothetical protein